jgi:hypothetical protein
VIGVRVDVTAAHDGDYVPVGDAVGVFEDCRDAEAIRTASNDPAEHLAGVGCDPLAFRIVALIRQREGWTTAVP